MTTTQPGQEQRMELLEQQTERLKADTPLNDVDFAGATVADLRALGDRLILYREARDVLAELVETIEQAFPALALQPIMVRASALLSRSGDD